MHPVVQSVLDFLGARKKKARSIRVSIPDVMPKLPRWQRRRLECAKAQVRHQRLRAAGREHRERIFARQSHAIAKAWRYYLARHQEQQLRDAA